MLTECDVRNCKQLAKHAHNCANITVHTCDGHSDEVFDLITEFNVTLSYRVKDLRNDIRSIEVKGGETG